jgi:hypothetical protein
MVFYGDEFDVFMAGEMFEYLSKTILRTAEQNVRKTAKLKYREHYKRGLPTALKGG